MLNKIKDFFKPLEFGRIDSGWFEELAFLRYSNAVGEANLTIEQKTQAWTHFIIKEWLID